MYFSYNNFLTFLITHGSRNNFRFTIAFSFGITLHVIKRRFFYTALKTIKKFQRVMIGLDVFFKIIILILFTMKR